MAISFPSNPNTNDVYSYNNKSWTYNGSVWVQNIGGGATVSVANTAPATAQVGTLWWDSDTGDFSVYYNNTWAGLTAAGPADGSITTAKLADGSVTSVKLATGIAMPTQTGQTGKYLTTDGTNASWTTVTTAGTVTANAQPNITSTGTLTGLTVAGLSTFTLSAESLSTLTGATGTVVHDTSVASTFYHTSPAANFTANFTNIPTTNNQDIVVALVIVQGSTAYVPTVMQINGTTQTVIWSGGSAPTGNASKYDIISYSLFRVGSAWVVFGNASSNG